MKSLRRFEGELLIDHRASPGIPEDAARAAGLPPQYVCEGAVYETATLSCAHCAGVYRKNPYRIRPREFCGKCNRYICDFCGREAAKPDYVHRSFQELADMVRGGRVTIAGGTASAPILIPTSGV
jgi:hypothetical protein